MGAEFWFRLIHLLMIVMVVEENLFGVLCPLTDWEDRLRLRAGETIQEGTFVGRLLHNLLFWDVSPGTLAIVYYLFGLAVLLIFLFAPPRWPWKKDGQK